MWRWIWKHKAKLSLLYFGFWAAALPFGVDYLVRTKFLPPVIANHNHLEVHYPAILADFKFLEANPIFKESPRLKNAEAYLSDSLAWDGLEASPALRVAKEKLKIIDEKYAGWRKDANQMRKLYESADLNNTDTDWVEGILEFDHWDMSTRREIAQQLQKAGQSTGIAKIGIFASMPYPDFINFHKSVVLHYLKLTKTGRGVEGLKLLRHAAILAQSSSTLVGQMITVSMLRDEANLAAAFGVPWTPVSDERINAFKRVAWAWPGLVRTVWFSEFPAQFVPYLRPEMGMCAGVFETAAGLGGFQDFLEPRFWFETDFSKELARVREFETKTQAICKLHALAPLRNRTPASANTWSYDAGALYEGSGRKQEPNFARMPYVRRIVALIIMGISSPNYGRLYEEEKQDY